MDFFLKSLQQASMHSVIYGGTGSGKTRFLLDVYIPYWFKAAIDLDYAPIVLYSLASKKDFELVSARTLRVPTVTQYRFGKSVYTQSGVPIPIGNLDADCISEIIQFATKIKPYDVLTDFAPGRQTRTLLILDDCAETQLAGATDMFKALFSRISRHNYVDIAYVTQSTVIKVSTGIFSNMTWLFLINSGNVNIGFLSKLGIKDKKIQQNLLAILKGERKMREEGTTDASPYIAYDIANNEYHHLSFVDNKD